MAIALGQLRGCCYGVAALLLNLVKQGEPRKRLASQTELTTPAFRQSLSRFIAGERKVRSLRLSCEGSYPCLMPTIAE